MLCEVGEFCGMIRKVSSAFANFLENKRSVKIGELTPCPLRSNIYFFF